MKAEVNINNVFKKPKYITRYERIFNELLKYDSLNNDNITDRFSVHQKNNTFYENFNTNTLLLYSRNLNKPSNYNTISNTKYQLITGRDLNENKIKLNQFEKKKVNNKYERYEPEYLMKNLKKKQNIVRNFKEYIKKTEKIYENYRESNSINKIFPNHNRSRNLSGNIFIEKLYNQFPEYTTLTNRGQTFLSTKTLKENEFRSLKNKLKHI